MYRTGREMRFARLAVAAGITLSVLGLAPSASRAYTQRFTVTGLPVRWSMPRVPLRIDPTLGGDAAAALEAGRIAFAAWGGIPNVPTLALEGEAQRAPGFASSGSNENGVYQVASLPIGGTALAVTVSTYRQDDGILLDADILVKDSRDVRLLDAMPARRDRRRYDLASLLAHESGHVLGLGESMDDASATMWPRLALGDTSARTIEADDEAGVRAIYAETVLEEEGAAPTGGPALLGAGCGVARRAARAPGIDLGRGASAVMVVALLGLAFRARGRKRRRGLVGLALLLVGAQFVVASPGVRADESLRGVARVRGTRWEGGLLMTDLEVIGPSGTAAVTVPGGARDGVVQQVGDALPPEDGAELRLDPPGADGWRRWSLATGAAGMARARNELTSIMSWSRRPASSR
jgi:hypothetical protein